MTEFAQQLYELGKAINRQRVLKINAWTEYDNAAADLARRGLKGAIGDPLPNLMTPEAVALINDDPEAFQERVRQSSYALAMSKIAD